MIWNLSPRLAPVLLPSSTRQSSQDEPLLVVRHLHDPRRLHLLSDPVALLQGVDEHELDADVAAVGGLEPLQDLAQRQRFLLAADKRGGWQFKHTIHVRLLCFKRWNQRNRHALQMFPGGRPRVI